MGANAAPVSFTYTPIPIQGTVVFNTVQASGAFLFPSFDSSLGTLSAATISYSLVSVRGYFAYTSERLDGILYPFILPVTEAETLQIGPSQASSSVSQNVLAGNFYAQRNLFGRIPTPNPNPPAGGSQTFFDAATLQFFQGQAGMVNIPFNVTYTAAYFSIPSPNIFSASLLQDQSVSTQATLTYNYVAPSAATVPEPSTFLPILLLATFGALRLLGTRGARVRQ